MTKPEDLSHLTVTPAQILDAVETEERKALNAANSPEFRALFGDALADEVAAMSQEHLDQISHDRRTLISEE